MIIVMKDSMILGKLDQLLKLKQIIRIVQYKLSIHIRSIKHLFAAGSHQSLTPIRGMFILALLMEKYLFMICLKILLQLF